MEKLRSAIAADEAIPADALARIGGVRLLEGNIDFTFLTDEGELEYRDSFYMNPWRRDDPQTPDVRGEALTTEINLADFACFPNLQYLAVWDERAVNLEALSRLPKLTTLVLDHCGLTESDLLTIMRATVDGTLADTPVEFASGAACCVVLASGGYPVSYKSGYPISGLDEAGKTATVFHAGTKLVDGQIVTAGGRVLGVTATADTLEAAIDKAYQAADKITFTDMHMRRDIGQRALASRKESHS